MSSRQILPNSDEFLITIGHKYNYVNKKGVGDKSESHYKFLDQT